MLLGDDLRNSERPSSVKPGNVDAAGCGIDILIEIRTTHSAFDVLLSLLDVTFQS